jgi:hypothetical protein
MLRLCPEITSKGISEMNRILGAAAVIATIAALSNFVVVRPEATAATNASANTASTNGEEDSQPMISPFDLMLKYGKNLPREDWRPTS